MRNWILAILPVAVFAAGCDDPCKQGIALRNDLTTLETLVTGTVVEPTALDSSCYDFRKTWDKKLRSGSKLATKVARKYLYSEERVCVRGHYERRCGYYGDPDPFYPGPHYPGRDRRRDMPPYSCYSEYVCDFVRVTPHKKEGYDQANRAAIAMKAAGVDLKEACAAHSKNDPVGAIAELTSAKAKLRPAIQNTDYALEKAGCFDRKGD